MHWKRYTLVALFIILALMFAGCQPAAEQPSGEEPAGEEPAEEPMEEMVFKVGFLGPFSGPSAQTGKQFTGGITMALESYERSLGSDHPLVEELRDTLDRV